MKIKIDFILKNKTFYEWLSKNRKFSETVQFRQERLKEGISAIFGVFAIFDTSSIFSKILYQFT